MPTSVPTVTLNNGVEIPQLGVGVFQVPPEETTENVTTALGIGYRHVDTAQGYGNERQVGDAIAKSDLDPTEVFVTTKLNNRDHGYDAARRAIDQSLVDLQREKIDLLLIHWPMATVSDFVETWRALEGAYRDGLTRSIGLSNFEPHHIRRLLAETTIRPAANQIELHPYLAQDELRAFDAEHEIATEAWSPIAQGAVLDDPVITDLARTHGKSPAQVVLRWHIQIGTIVFPKSLTPSRLQENFELFDFALSREEMASVSGLDRGERTGPHPDEFAVVPD